MKYYTIDSKISFERDKMYIQNIKYDPNRQYRFHSFAALSFLMAWEIYSALNGNPYRWFIAAVIFIWMYPHLERFYKFLFVNKWGGTIRLNDIMDVIKPEPENELETKVVLKFKKGRRKELIFRSRENQVEGFLDTIQQFNSKNLSIAH